jgi:hypothetical protein
MCNYHCIKCGLCNQKLIEYIIDVEELHKPRTNFTLPNGKITIFPEICTTELDIAGQHQFELITK